MRALLRRLAAVLLGLGLALGLAEVALRVMGLPVEPGARTTTDQFALDHDPVIGWTSTPHAEITFTYPSPTAGTESTGVVHHTNGWGLRGPPWPEIRRGRVIAFAGDSFTFGEGVRDEAIYVETVPGLLGEGFTAANLGVGGYNTTQAVAMLGRHLERLDPEAVVLGYVLNDAEPPLFEILDGEPVRRERGELFDGATAGSSRRGPRLLALASGALDARRRSRAAVEHYRALYASDAPGWRASQAALGALGELDVPVLVVIWPLLAAGEPYPFDREHELIAQAASDAGLEVLDLRGAFDELPRDARIVHPVDQHPSQAAHAIAAERIADALGPLLQERP